VPPAASRRSVENGEGAGRKIVATIVELSPNAMEQFAKSEKGQKVYGKIAQQEIQRHTEA